MQSTTHPMPIGTLARRTMLAGLVASVLVTGLFHEAFAGRALAAANEARAVAAATADARAAKTDTAAPKPRHLKTLDEAVDARLLDAKVARELRDHGSVNAFVQFKADAVRADAQIRAPHGKGHAKAIVKAQRAGFEALKGRALKAAADLRVAKRYPNLSTSLVTFTSSKAILRVLADPDVRSITLPRTGRLNLAQSLPQIRQPQVQAAGNTGAGTYVAVIDTGVNYGNAAFGACTAPGGSCKVYEAADYAPNDGARDDDNHGTNVAGIVLGVAPGAKVLAYDVFQVVGFALDGTPIRAYDDSYIFAAFDRVAALRASLNIASVNLSLGVQGTYNRAECQYLDGGAVNPWTAELATLRGLGIAPVFAAGNNAAKDGSFVEGVSYPSCTPGAIRVGAVYDANIGQAGWGNGAYVCNDPSTAVDRPTCFSQNSRALLTVFAPGSEITAAGITESGTSQASPHVAGAFAVLHAARPAATIASLTNAIATSGPLIGDTRFAGGTFWKGRLDLAAALAAVPAGDTTAPTFTLTPRVGFTPGAILATNGSISVDTDWAATDASGIASYAIMISVNGGAWVDKTAALASPTQTKLTFTGMAPGTQYWIQVAARDKAGNWSAWKVLGPFQIYAVDQTSATITRSTGWATSAWASAYGGSLSMSSTAGAWTNYAIPARSIAVVGTSATNRGAATVKVGTLSPFTMNENAATTTARRVQYTVAGLNPAASTNLRVTVTGTAGHPTVDVDAILVIQ